MTTITPAHLAEHEDDENAAQAGYVKGTDFSLPYTSAWSRRHQAEVDAGVLRHLGCGFVSTPGTPPTLLALKQHAQSLCVLIRLLDPGSGLGSGSSTSNDDDGDDGDDSDDDEEDDDDDDSSAFDWLADLSTPYTNDDPAHHKPLAGLLNEVSGRDGVASVTHYHCALAEATSRSSGSVVSDKPYANHTNLLMHANECLERLDHELGPSAGGLLGLLPTTTTTTTTTTTPSPVAESDTSASNNNSNNKDESQPLQQARNTLLGQWLTFTQLLVARTHDLERSYADALDALAGEATLAYQHLSALGPDARAAGRAVAFPQDRWVLANCGDAVFRTLHGLLDRREAEMQARQRAWREVGVAGERMFLDDGVINGGRGADADGDREREREQLARGIVAVDVSTRYYRLAGQKHHGTLFVVPGHAAHPGVAHTRDVVQRQPTVVVSSALPPSSAAEVPLASASELERRCEVQIARAAGLEAQNAALERELRRALRERDRLMQHAAAVRGGQSEEGPRVAALEREVREKAAIVDECTARVKREHGKVTRLLQMLRKVGIDPQMEPGDVDYYDE